MTQQLLVLLGSIGWGLLACGAVTHVWHHARLRSLLARHLDHERLPALALTTVEAILVLGVMLAVRNSALGLIVASLASTVVAVGFLLWILRLIVTGSDLPCACSFSDAPTTWWSFARAGCVALVACFALVDQQAYVSSSTSGETVATMLVGWAVAGAIFVLPEALHWPEPSRALLARVDAYVASPTDQAAS